MLPKPYRLTKTSEFQHAFSGQKIHGKHLLLFMKPNTFLHARLGIVVSKKVDKRAVVRNRLARVLRADFMTLHARHRSVDVVVVVRANPKQSKADWMQVRSGAWQSDWALLGS